MITAACYEHVPVLGCKRDRLADFENRLLATLDGVTGTIRAWVVLPNHYHVLICTADIGNVLRSLARLHGRTSFEWNGQDAARHRKIWCSAVDTRLRSDRHFHAVLNYIHHNPVKHGYAEKWTDWPFSSAAAYLDAVGRERAAHDWCEYDISTMGLDWDP